MVRIDHPVERFRQRLQSCDCFPDGVVPIQEPIGGTAAFPAGCGLFRSGYDDPLPPFPYGGVMFVAHNVDSEKNFLRRLAARQPHGGEDNPMSYWRGVKDLLRAARLRIDECFFTNVYVGLKAGADPEGSMRVRHSSPFSNWCAEFLREQISEMKPRGIAVMGAPAWSFVAKMIPEVAGWRNRPVPAVATRAFLDGQHTTVLVPLFHPSGQGRFRHIRGYSSNSHALQEEAKLLRQAAGEET